MKKIEKEKILNIINIIRNGNKDFLNYFMNEGSISLFLILKELDSKAKLYYSPFANNVITELHGNYYDIRGEVELPSHYSTLDKVYKNSKIDIIVKELINKNKSVNYTVNNYLPKQINIKF